MTISARCALSVLSLTVAVLPPSVDAAEEVLYIPAASFSSDGLNQDLYSNWGWYLDTNTTKNFHAGVKLPNAARITSVDMMTLDTDVGTISGYLKRTRFGVDGGTETLLSFASPGSIGCTGTGGLCHDIESPPDMQVDAANYSYWFQIRVPDETGTGTDLRFYAVRIVYEVDDVIFADTFESGDTGMWSSESTAKSALQSKRSVPPDQAGPVAEPGTPDQRLEEFLSTLYIEDPLAQEALEKAVMRVDGYASPLVIPGPAFKTKGYTDYDDYYFSETSGFVYGRPAGNGITTMVRGLQLPEGAEISYFLAYFVDSVTDYAGAPKSNIDFWLARYHTTDGDIIDMVDVSSVGASSDIVSLSVSQAQMEAVETGCSTISNGSYYYWLGFSLGPYDTSPPAPYDAQEWWHKVYAIVILYSMP